MKRATYPIHTLALMAALMLLEGAALRSRR